MNNFEAVAFSSSKTTFTSVGNGHEASTSSSTSVVIYGGLSKFSFDLVIAYIDDVLSAITNESLRSKMVENGMKLRDMVEPVASDFSKLCEGISQGAKMFSDQKSLTSNLSSEAHTVALDVLKGVGNAHWAAVGLLAIANVLERLDKISTNDRDCIDLLKGMLDLAKFIKMLKDIDADSHGAILGKMSEALHLIVSGAILCHSFIRCNKISKFLLTKKISEELVYVRGKVDRMKTDFSLQMNYIIMTSITFPKKQSCSHDSDGRLQHQLTVYTGEKNDTYETELCISESQLQCGMQENCLPESNNQSSLIRYDNSSKKNGEQPQEMPSPTKSRFARYIRYTTNGLKRIAGHKFQGCQKLVQTLSWRQAAKDLHITMDDDGLSKFAIEMGFGWIPIRFTFEELLLATNRFQGSRLGQGGFGSAYLGTLPNGRQVVIKRSRQRTDGLMQELVCMANLHHRNILKLVGFCITGNELLLVSDYICNGSLSNLLFNPITTRALDWSTRWKIIEGVINALLYLQEGADVCIVHRDIKPSNILLDENFNAKISDFGIARGLPSTKSASTFGGHERIASLDATVIDYLSNSEYSTEICGTRGYIAPESIVNGHVTRKTDIYSFGVLLLNLVSGKKTIEFTSLDKGLYNLTEQVFALHREKRLVELIDPELEKMGGFEEESALRSILIAIWCIQGDPNRRPSVSEVSLMLSTRLEIPPPPDVYFAYVYPERPDQSPYSSLTTSPTTSGQL